jgi:ubiquinone/menaquinone biosynthesis C-methylase UbiE
VTISRSAFLLAFAGFGRVAAENRPIWTKTERKSLMVSDFRADTRILDVGGGGEGIIGRMKPEQVIAIDLFKRELEEAPPGPLKIVMDASDMRFLDASFPTVTAFYSLMYMKPEVQAKVFVEVARVLQPGGRWLIWDAIVPQNPNDGTKGIVFYFDFQLPHAQVKTGYGTPWPDRPYDESHYRALARQAGLQVVASRRDDSVFSTMQLELRRA